MPMPRLLLLPLAFLALLILPLAAAAQAQAPAPAQPAEPAAAAALTPAEARALAELLNSEDSLRRLRDKLNALAAALPAAPPPAAAKPAPGLARQVAEATREAAESGSRFLGRLLADLQGLAAWETKAELELEPLGVALAELVGVILATAAIYILFGFLGRRATGRLARRGKRAGVFTAAALLALTLAIDAIAILASWAAGYGAALFMSGPLGEMEIEQSLFLNAFLLVGLVRVVLDGIFSPRHGSLRIPPMSDLNAAYWYHWLSRITGILGYGLLFLAPIAAVYLGPAVARGLQLLVALTALVIAILVILQNRRALRDRLTRRPEAPAGFFDHLADFIGRFWHVVAIAYVVALFAIWLSRPQGALTFILSATGKTALAILLGFLAVSAVSRAISGGLRLPQDLRDRLPLLETRLNAFVPNVLRVVRVVIFAVVVAALLEAWGTADVSGWLASEFGTAVAAALLSAALVLVVAWLAWLAMSSWVEYRLNPNVGTVPSAREKTLLQLLRNAATVTIAAVAVMLALAELGVDIGPLLAGAGVVGLAIGFGAQKMVQDVITGVFIQFENAINEGDVVTAGGTTGVVEKLTIRSVGLRDLSGIYHIVPFSSVDTVSNFMRGFAFHIAAIGVAYREDIAEVKEAMHEAFDMLRDTEHWQSIIGELEMHGITEFGDSAIVVRARIKTLPGNQWAVGRAYNEFIKTVFDRRGIEIPFPHRTIYWGEDKAGKAPPLRVLREGKDGAAPDARDGGAPSGTDREPPAVEPPPPVLDLPPPDQAGPEEPQRS